MRKLRILYCTDTLMSGGTEHQLIELIKRLDSGRFEIYVLCLYGARVGRTLHFAEPLQNIGIPVKVLDIGWTPIDKVRALVSIVREVWHIEPDILHAVNYHSNLLTRLARPLLPSDLCLIGSVSIEYTPKQLLYERLSWWLCESIICISWNVEQQLTRQANVPQRRVVTIVNGVDLDRFARSPDPALRERIASGAGHVLTMIGRVTKQKSPHLLAEAIGRLKSRSQLPPEIRVLIVGERESEEEHTRLEAAINQYDLHDVVIQYPQTHQPESYFHASDVIVLASILEGLPNVILESLAAGVPVIVSEAANKARIVAQNETGWIVRTGDVEHLVETIEQVLSLPKSQLLAMRPACVSRAKEFSMTAMVRQHEELYIRLRATPNT